MKKNLILYILLLFLVVANGFFLVNYLGRPEAREANRGPGDFLSKELRFDADQMQQFKKLSDAHNKEVKGLLQELKNLKHELFKRSHNESNDMIVINAIATRIGEHEKQKDLLSFKYFKNIRALCNAEQKKQFEKLIEKALIGGDRDIEGEKGNHPPPPPPSTGERR